MIDLSRLSQLNCLQHVSAGAAKLLTLLQTYVLYAADIHNVRRRKSYFYALKAMSSKALASGTGGWVYQSVTQAN